MQTPLLRAAAAAGRRPAAAGGAAAGAAVLRRRRNKKRRKKQQKQQREQLPPGDDGADAAAELSEGGGLAAWTGLAMDISVLCKAVLASAAVYLLLEPGALVSCDGNSGAGLTATEVEFSLCQPSVELHGARRALLGLIVCSLSLFVGTLSLRYAVPWLARRTPLTRYAQPLAYLVSFLAGLVVLGKLSVVYFAFFAPLTFRCAPGSESQYCTELTFPYAGSSGDSNTFYCTDNCVLKPPIEAAVLTVNFLVSALYNMYLAYRFYQDSEAEERRRTDENRVFFASASEAAPARAGAAAGPAAAVAAAASAAAQRAAEAEATRVAVAAAPLTEADKRREQALSVLVGLEKQRVLDKAAVASHWEQFYFQVARDVAAVVKYVSTVVSLALVVLSSGSLVECQPALLLGAGGTGGDLGIAASSQQVSSECESQVPLLAPTFVFLASAVVLLFVFVFGIVVDKGLYFRSSYRQVVFLFLAVCASAAAGLVTYVVWLSSFELSFFCDPGNDQNAAACTSATVGVRQLDATVYVRCESQCTVAVPAVVAVLVANLGLSLCYMVTLILHYRSGVVLLQHRHSLGGGTPAAAATKM